MNLILENISEIVEYLEIKNATNKNILKFVLISNKNNYVSP